MQESVEFIKQAFELKSQKSYKQAIEMLYKALEIENDNIEIFYQLGELYFLLNNFQRATHYIEKVLINNPNHLEALEIIEKIYDLSKDYTKAFAIAEKILTLQNNEKNLLEFIDISSKKGDLKKIKEIENSEQNSDSVLYAIAKAYYDNKEPQEAEQKLEQALKINPDNENALVLIGKIYFDKSEFEKSKEIFKSLSNNTENPEILNYLGLFALEELKFTDAIKYFSKASNIDKKSGKYLYNLANAYFYNGWIKEAVASYLQAILLEPDNIGYRYSLAYLYFEQKAFDKAQNEVNFILEQNSNYSPAHVLNALLKFENKDFLGAKSELETNLKNGNDDNFTLVSISKVYTELSMYDKAEDAIRKAIKRLPDSYNYQCQLAEILLKENKTDEAIDIINGIISQNENYISAYITGAKAYMQKRDFENAKIFAQNAISLDMNYGEGYYYLALVRFEEKDFDEAIECMKRAIIFDVENAQYYAKMSEFYQAKEDYKTALEYIKEAEDITGSSEYRIEYQKLASINRKNLTKK